MSDLKLCPKCGGAPVIDHTPCGRFAIMCFYNMSCGHHTKPFLSEQQAKDAWNEDNPMPLAEYHFPIEESK